MANIGIDVGAENIKVAIVDKGKILATASVPTGISQLPSAQEALKLALDKAKLARDGHIIRTTGSGRKAIVSISSDEVSEMAAAGSGAHYFFPSARTVIDAGAEESRAVSVNESGKVKDFAVNEKCAAGSGSFTESMAKALELTVEEMAKLSLESTKKVAMNAQCAVFAESEVVSLIHSGTSKADISRAVHDSIADRISAVARRVGLVKDLVLIGGMAKDVGFVDSFKRALNMDVLVPPNPEFASAIGAAIYQTT